MLNQTSHKCWILDTSSTAPQISSTQYAVQAGTRRRTQPVRMCQGWSMQAKYALTLERHQHGGVHQDPSPQTPAQQPSTDPHDLHACRQIHAGARSQRAGHQRGGEHALHRSRLAQQLYDAGDMHAGPSAWQNTSEQSTLAQHAYQFQDSACRQVHAGARSHRTRHQRSGKHLRPCPDHRSGPD